MSEIEPDSVWSCRDLRMDECYRERDLMGWPPVISLTQDSHLGSSVGSGHNSSSGQTTRAAKRRGKAYAKQKKSRRRREAQKARKRGPARIQHRLDNMGETIPANRTPTLSGRALYKFRRNLKGKKEGMVTHLCPDFDVEDTIRNTPKTQPSDNNHLGFEIENEPTLKLVGGDLVTLSDKYVPRQIVYPTGLFTCSVANPFLGTGYRVLSRLRAWRRP